MCTDSCNGMCDNCTCTPKAIEEWPGVEQVEDLSVLMETPDIAVTIGRVPVNFNSKEYQLEQVHIRVDIRKSDMSGIPLKVFVGKAKNVYKRVVQWLGLEGYGVSPEFASYLGYEIARANSDYKYVQD